MKFGRARESRTRTIPSAYEIFNHLRQAGAVLLEPAHGDFLERLREADGVLMRGFQDYEEALEGDSFSSDRALPHAQAFAAEFLGLGNEQVLLGRNRWLFYEPDVAYLTGPGFLDPSFPRRRTRSGDSSATRAIEADPLKAIVQFRDQLKGRGIHLVIMPIPLKPMIEPESLSIVYRPPLPIPLQESILRSFPHELGQVQFAILTFWALWRSAALAREFAILAHRYHWTPEAMQPAIKLAAEKLVQGAWRRAQSPSYYIAPDRPSTGWAIWSQCLSCRRAHVFFQERP